MTDDLLAVLRRDWAVRVLDAWASSLKDKSRRSHWVRTYAPHDVQCDLLCDGRIESRHGGLGFASEAAARHAAALAVFPTLPADKHAELGECPSI